MNRNHKSGQKRIPDDSARWPPFPVSNLRSPVSPIHPCQQASSLVTTLLVLVILSIIVVAFLQSMNVERNVARSAMNRYRAEQAADAGMDTAAAAAAQPSIDS